MNKKEKSVVRDKVVSGQLFKFSKGEFMEILKFNPTAKGSTSGSLREEGIIDRYLCTAWILENGLGYSGTIAKSNFSGEILWEEVIFCDKRGNPISSP